MMNYSTDNFIRTTEKRHYRGVARRCGRSWSPSGDIYLGKYAGWYSVRDETYFTESETEVGPDKKRRAPRPAPRSSGSRSQSISSGFRPGRPAARRSTRRTRASSRRRPAQRSRQLREGRPAGSLGVAHQLLLGRAGAGRSQARDLRLARRAHQLHHRSAATPTPATRCGGTGRPTCTWSARTSSVSTACSGRPS